jgi:hypothetical protein
LLPACLNSALAEVSHYQELLILGDSDSMIDLCLP